MQKNPQISFPKNMVEGSIVTRFEQQVNIYGNKIAVKSHDQVLTYQELNFHANRVSRAILSTKYVQTSNVGMIFEHNVSAVIAILGILKAGKTYVPLDPSFPKTRLKYMIEDSEVGILLTNSNSISNTKDLFPVEKIINIDNLDSNIGDEDPGLTIPTKTLAFILYSSGSTGTPKGIVQDHRNVLHHVWDHTTQYQFGDVENHALVLSFSFAASISEIFCPILNGGTLSLYDIKQGGLIDLASWLENEGITILKIPISLFRIIISTLSGEGKFPKLRIILLGGDTLYRKDVVEFRKHFSRECVLVNRLTSTETNSVSQFIIKPGVDIEDRVVPVGYPAHDKEIMILDESGNRLESDQVGEIVIKSRYISPGYWKLGSLNREKFKAPAEANGGLIFHTGDLGRIRADGCLEHIGRTDFMVKIRGFRVEMAEITAVLLEMDSVADAVVVATPDSTGEKQLVGYVIPVGTSILSKNLLRQKLSEDLPDYMIPTEFVFLEKMPKTPTGKIDYQNLPDVETTTKQIDGSIVPPETRIEKQLGLIWEKVLNQDHIGIEDDFFDLGGNSLDALRMMAAVEEEYSTELSFTSFLQDRTIKRLASLLQSEKPDYEYRHLVEMSRGGTKPPFFCVPPSATTAMTFGKLAQYMADERSFYGFEYQGMDGKSEPHMSINEMASRNIEEMQTVQAHGPYQLGGMCFGGLVAYEMAQQLLNQGEEVAFLGILDSTHAPNLATPRGYYVFLVTRFINQKFLKGRFTIGATSTRIPGDDHFRNQVQHVFSSHNYARMKYRTLPYPGDITLFSTTGGKGQFSREQWKPAVRGKLEIVIIPGDHLGHNFGLAENENSFIQDPHVKVLAEKLNHSLNKVNSG